MRVRRGQLHDVYIEDGQGVVMVAEQIVVLSDLATVILEAVPVGTVVDLEDIVEAVLEEFGPPEPPHDAPVLTQARIHDLIAHGVLVLHEGAPNDPSPHSDQAATVALHSAMSSVLAPPSRWTLPSDVPPDSFLAAVRRQRVGAQVVTAIDRLELPSELRARLQADGDAMRVACLGLGRDLHRVLDVLSSAGIRALAFKGLALAAQAWGDETARGYGDLDVLVAPADLETAHAVLVADGWQHPTGYPLPGPSWGWRQFTRTNYEMPMSLASTPLDLHWHSVPARDAFPAFDELWERRATVMVSGRPVPTFSLYDALAHSASHSAKDHWRWLRGLADVHQLVAKQETWLEADRPLRHDQMMSVGLAVRMFGIPPTAPPVVRDAARLSARSYVTSVRGQLAPEHATIDSERQRLFAVLKSYLPIWRTRPRPREMVRHVARTALPARLLANEGTKHAVVAVPRIMWRRSAEVASRVSRRNS